MPHSIDPPVTHYIYYNGFTFPELAKYTVNTEAMLGENGLARYGSKVTVNVEFLLTANDPIPDGPYGAAGSTTNDGTGGTIAGTLDEVGVVSSRLKQLLEQPNRPFALINTGFGDIVMNTGSLSFGTPAETYQRTHYPLTPGPQVTVQTFRPAGYNTIAGFTVTFTFVIKTGNTSGSKIDPGDNRNYVYSDFYLERGWDIDSQSQVTRNTNGNFKLLRPTDKVGGWKHGLRLEELLNDVVPPLTSFKRKQSYNVRGDGITVDFSITDTLIPSASAYPVGADDLSSISYSIESTSPTFALATSIWMHTITGNIKTRPNVSRSTAWQIMLWVIRGRVASTLGRTSTASAVIFKHFKVEEHPFDWTAGLSFTYTWQASYSLQDILKNSGIFVEYNAGKEADWKPWQDNADESYRHWIGGMPISDAEIEMKPVSAIGTEQVPPKLNDKRYFPPPEPPPSGGLSAHKILTPGPPPANRSYEAYVMTVTLITEDRTAVIYQGSPRQPRDGKDFQVGSGWVNDGNCIPPNQGGAAAAKLFNAGPSCTKIRVTIMASRYNRYPQIARLVKVGDQVPLTLSSPTVDRMVVPVSQGVNRHLLTATTDYILENELTQDMLDTLVFSFGNNAIARN